MTFVDYTYKAQVIFEPTVHLGSKPNGHEKCQLQCQGFQSLKLKFSELWIGTTAQGFEFYGAG